MAPAKSWGMPRCRSRGVELGSRHSLCLSRSIHRRWPCGRSRKRPHRVGRARCEASERGGKGAEESLEERCLGGNPDIELCVTDEEFEVDVMDPLSVRDKSTAALFGLVSKEVFDEAYTRGRWLVGLLVLQSSSSFVLDKFQELLKDHIVVTLFLTMLVGAGGNAGNQSAIKVIRGLATKKMDGSLENKLLVLGQQVQVGIFLGVSLATIGYLRVYLTNGSHENAFAISLSLFFIVLSSTVLGTTLPFLLFELGVDPANAGTSIQVIMDILGVTITCVTCNFVLTRFAETVAATPDALPLFPV